MHGRATGPAGVEQSFAVCGPGALRVEQKRGRGDVLSAREDRAHLVDVGVARGVEHAVGIEGQHPVHVGRRRHADRFPPDQHAHVGSILVGRIDARADDLEVRAVVDDRGEHLAAHRAGAPCDDAMAPTRRVVHADYSTMQGAAIAPEFDYLIPITST